jgi:putative hemolysin
VTTFEFISAIALISFSGFLAGSELALFSLSRFQLRSLKEKFKTQHKKIKKLLQDASGLLVTILVLNEVANITFSSLMAKVIANASEKFNLAERMSHQFRIPAWEIEVFLGILITAPIVLFLGEITPKIIGTKINILIAPLIAGPMNLIYDLFSPFRKVIKELIAWVTRFSGSRNTNTSESAILKESDFLLMVEEGHKEGAIEQNELDLIKNIFNMDETTVGEIYTPIQQVQTLNENTTIKEALSFMRTQRYSRIPVTGHSKEEVIGILYSKDLLRAKVNPELLQTPISEIVKDVVVTYKNTKLNALFRKFKLQKTHMAVVQSDSNQTVGVVTMNDVLDAVFEDIIPDEDEYYTQHMEDT